MHPRDPAVVLLFDFSTRAGLFPSFNYSANCVAPKGILSLQRCGLWLHNCATGVTHRFHRISSHDRQFVLRIRDSPGTAAVARLAPALTRLRTGCSSVTAFVARMGAVAAMIIANSAYQMNFV
jgi:hypothetical protein